MKQKSILALIAATAIFTFPTDARAGPGRILRGYDPGTGVATFCRLATGGYRCSERSPAFGRNMERCTLQVQYIIYRGRRYNVGSRLRCGS